MRNINEVMTEFIEFSLPTFANATSFSSLDKLAIEVIEVKCAMDNDVFGHLDAGHLAEEYADCIMCLFDSAARAGVGVESINAALCRKLVLNKSRKWVENADKTYSHIK